MGNDGKVAPNAGSCTGVKPEAELKCAATAACVTFAWSAPDFVSCPSACGATESFIFTRAVSCMGSDGVPTPHQENCSGPKPPTELKCAATLPCPVFKWQADAFGKCPSECGQPETTLTRVVQCVDSSGKRVAPNQITQCSAQPKPP